MTAWYASQEGTSSLVRDIGRICSVCVAGFVMMTGELFMCSHYQPPIGSFYSVVMMAGELFVYSLCQSAHRSCYNVMMMRDAHPEFFMAGC